MRTNTNRFAARGLTAMMLGLGTSFLVIAGNGAPVSAATFVVDSTADAPDANAGDGVCAAAGGACTLRAAVEETNALAGADTITLPAGTYTISTPLLPSGDLTIDGAGAASSIVTGDPGTLIWLTNGAITLNVSGITFRETDLGDCILVTDSSSQGPGAAGSTVNVTSSVFDRCPNVGIIAATDSAGADGGPVTINVTDTLFAGGSTGSYGVLFDTRGGTFSADNVIVEDTTATGLWLGFNDGPTAAVAIADSIVRNNDEGLAMFGNAGTLTTVEVTNSTFDGNLSYHAYFRGDVTIDDSSFVNSPGDDGSLGDGVLWDEQTAGSQLVLRRSTVADNLGPGVVIGGSTDTVLIENSTISGNGENGIFSSGKTRLVNSTIVGNGEAGINPGDDDTFVNTIVHGNATADCDTSQPVVSEGGNIDGDGSCGFTQPLDQPSTDPLLGPLADNGGPTLTHLPAAGSPALDRGVTAGCPATDQRGTSRPQGTACDAGSVEVASQAVTTTTVAPTTVAPTTVTPTTVAPTIVAPTTVSPSPPITVAPTLPATGSGGPERTTFGLALAALLAGLALIAISRRRTT